MTVRQPCAIQVGRRPSAPRADFSPALVMDVELAGPLPP